jgi:hypothetical protein
VNVWNVRKGQNYYGEMAEKEYYFGEFLL